jgi:phosphoglycolate phosphatase
LKNFYKKKSLFIFDLDGVLIDSKENMKSAWKKVKIKHDIKVSFNSYFQNIGESFPNILKKLKIKKNEKSIENTYKRESLKNINLINLYPGVKKTLQYLIKKKIKIVIVTSKDKFRSKKILKKLDVKIQQIYSPTKHLKGKPKPDLIFEAIKKNNSSKKLSLFVGDTISDRKAAKNAGVDFIFAKYGYKIGIKKSKYYINKFEKIKSIL